MAESWKNIDLQTEIFLLNSNGNFYNVIIYNFYNHFIKKIVCENVKLSEIKYK